MNHSDNKYPVQVRVTCTVNTGMECNNNNIWNGQNGYCLPNRGPHLGPTPQDH